MASDPPVGVDLFESQYDEGIFCDRDAPEGSFGDLDAVEELAEEARGCAHITMGVAPDGIPAPVDDQLDATRLSGHVSQDNLVCLAGPCRHYVERIVDDDGVEVVERFCLRLRAWAEPMRLGDACVEACSAHALESQVDLGLDSRLAQNRAVIREVNENAVRLGHDLGLCHAAGCKHYVVIVRRIVDGGEWSTGKKRFCAKISGAARLTEILSYQPVRACSVVEPGSPRDRGVSLALARGVIALETSRQKFAARLKDSEE